MRKLSNDEISIILSYLDLKDLVHAGLINTSFNKVSLKLVNYKISYEDPDYLLPHVLKSKYGKYITSVNSDFNLDFIPIESRTPKICELAIRANIKNIHSILNLKDNEDLIWLAVKTNGLVLQYIPDNQLTLQLCIVGIQQNPLSFELVPTELRSSELQQLALNQGGLALGLILCNDRTYTICKSHIFQDGQALRYVCERKKIKANPEITLTEIQELCEIAVQKDGLALRYVLQSCMSKDLEQMAIRQNPLSFQHCIKPDLGDVPESERSLKICELAMIYNPQNFKYIPVKYRNDDMCKIAIESDPDLVQYVPKDSELWWIMRHSDKVMKYAPQQQASKYHIYYGNIFLRKLRWLMQSKEPVMFNLFENRNIPNEYLKEAEELKKNPLEYFYQLSDDDRDLFLESLIKTRPEII